MVVVMRKTFLYVSRIADTGTVYGRLLQYPGYTAFPVVETPEMAVLEGMWYRKPHTRELVSVANADGWAKNTKSFAVGDIIAAEKTVGWPNGDDVAIQLDGPHNIVGTAPSYEAAIAMLEDHPEFRISKSMENVHHDVADEMLRDVPNDALAIAVRNDNGEIFASVVAIRGPYLSYEIRGGDYGPAGFQAADLGLPAAETCGLLVLRDGSYFEELDGPVRTRYGLNGDWESISVADACEHFGITRDNLEVQAQFNFGCRTPLEMLIEEAENSNNVPSMAMGGV
ncbi:hypothetical protein TH5_00875 [Thalassospira xianhensis MCCC 1A02616]|uniref:Uncharacterized protein n=1 Tax=Thalassospira xianhensis MCCC 1A02616 TaxID=1177929 RepID=A0A367UHL6_9PROT|nr:hypothetical protein TH5_00875 [Thalassospira xianhensis MCCC 1A02616]